MPRAAVEVDADAVRRQFTAGQRRDARQLVLPALNVEHAAYVMLNREADVGARHGEPPHDVEAGGIFALRAAQKLAPRRHAREQVLDQHARPPCQRRWPFSRSEEHTSELQSLMRISYAAS